MMKPLFTAVANLLFLMLTGCFTSNLATRGNSYRYVYTMLESEGISNDRIVKDLSYQDSLISVNFLIGKTDISFAMRNKSAQTIKIIWDETLFINFGTPGKVVHSGVKYIDRNSSQPPSVIPSGTTHEDSVTPTDKIYWRDGYSLLYSYTPGGWEKHDLFPTQDMNRAEFKSAILGSKGLEFSLYMPIQVNNTVKEYNFKFKIKDVISSS
jgi:hypothetical protein